MAEFQHLEIELKRIGEQLVKIMRDILRKQDHVASGRLNDSFVYRVDSSSDLVELNIANNAHYWERINDYGKGSGGLSVEYEVILEWMISSGKSSIFGGYSNDEKVRWAKNIARELASKYPTKFGRGDMGRSNFVEKADLIAIQIGLYNNIDTALPKEVDEYFKYLEEGGNVIDIFAG
tara:strand:- start:55 stop:588 length:534 start_codon:yes stop_codon:yes gene_type:complete